MSRGAAETYDGSPRRVADDPMGRNGKSPRETGPAADACRNKGPGINA